MKSSWPFSVKLSILFLAFFAGLLFMYVARDILVPLSFGLFLALVLYPLSKRLESAGLPRILAICVCLLLVFIVLLLIITLLSAQFVGFFEDLPDLTRKLSSVSEKALTSVIEMMPGNAEENMNTIKNGLLSFANTSTGLAKDTISATSDIFTLLGLIPIYVFLILLYRTRLKEFVFALWPDDKKSEIEDIIKNIQRVIKDYIAGLVTVILIIAVLNSVGLMIVGIDYALFFGVFAALLTVIPYVGVILGSLPPILMALVMYDSIWYAVAVLLVFLAVQSLEGNLLTPKIIGSKVSVNPLAAIVALFTGAKLWGTAGLILFIPFVAVLKTLFDAIEPLRPFGILLGERNDTNKPTMLERLWKRIRS